MDYRDKVNMDSEKEAIKMKLDKKIIKNLETGCTVWSYEEAKEIRKLQKVEPDWVKIISNMEELEIITGEHYDGTKTMPYFGAILTAKGRVNLL